MNVLLCITGGIAAYKTPALVRLLKKSGFELEIILTDAAEKFVSPLVLSTLNNKRVWRDADFLSAETGFKIPHIKLSQWADIIVIAPCSANTIAKITHGQADNLVSAAVLASYAEEIPVLLFPAMNENMFLNPVTQENLSFLEERNMQIIAPKDGELACGSSGKGRMPEPEEILEEVLRAAVEEHDLYGEHVLITAGPTREYIDPARFISNPSTGKMGIAAARTAWRRGANVKLVLGPVVKAPYSLYGLDVIRVNTALEMRFAVMQNLEWAKFIIKAAAVGDYRAKNFEAHKIKRENNESATIELTQNPDIAAEVGAKKAKDQILVGFAAETDDLMNNALLKLAQKNLDFVIANDISKPDGGFESDKNDAYLFMPNGENFKLSGTKFEVADKMWDFLVEFTL